MWVHDISTLKKTPSAKFSSWMQKPKNLGESLRKVCHTLSLNIINQNFEVPLDDEIDILGLSSSKDTICYVRQIVLVGDGLPFTYGRVVVPKLVYLSHMDKFNSLGSKLIGETLLYGNPETVRSAFEFNQIDSTHPLFNLTISALPDSATISKSFWARRSVFTISKNEPILITEIFLEDLPIYLD